MARLRMEVEGTERVVKLMEKVTQKAEELRQATDELVISVCNLKLSGTLEPSEDSAVTSETSQ